MVKISSDYLFIQSRVGPSVVIIIHFFVINILIQTGLPTVYFGYAAVALLHFFGATIWKLFLLNDAYVNYKTNEVIFKNLRDDEERFSRNQIVKLSNYAGITKVTMLDGNIQIKKYFKADSRDSVDYLGDGFQTSRHTPYQLDGSFEKSPREFLSKYKKLFFLPLITMSLLAYICLFLMKRDNHKISNYEFNGRVDSIWYDANRSNKVVTEPTIFIHGKSFDLFYHTWGFRHDIQPGDSMIKLKNTFIVTLVKKNGKRFVYSGD